MTPSNQKTKIGLSYIAVTGTAVIFSWVIHEFAHWATGELLGYEMVMTLNTCYPITRMYILDWHGTIISAAGPLITLMQAIVFYFLILRSERKTLFPFFLTCLYMRFLAGAISFINLNDEARISKALGLGPFVLPFLVFGILFYLTYRVVIEKGYNVKFITITTLLIMLFSSILILSDQAWKIIIL